MSPARREALAVAVMAAYAVLLGGLHVVPRYDAVVFPLFAWLTFKLLPEKGSRLLAALLAIGSLFAFAVLAHLWTTGHEGRAAVLWGIIPYSDAGQFASDAERVMYGLPIAEASRRPLYVVAEAGLLRWLGNDLRLTLATTTALFGLSLGYMTWEVMRGHGRWAGLVVFYVAALWVRRFTGFVGTEDIAFAPGALAFGLLLRTADLAVPRPRAAATAFGVGMLCLGLALAARPGPLLMIPGFLAWTLYAFRGRARWTALAAGVVGVVVAALALRVVAARFATGAAFNDYPNIVYALVHRCDLYCAAKAHPELATLPLDVRAKATLDIVLADVKREPSLLVIGPLDALFSFVLGAHGLFGFIWNTPDDIVLQNGPLVRRLVAERGWLGPLGHWVEVNGAFSLFNAACMGVLGAVFTAACIAGAVRIVIRRRSRRCSLVLFAIVGALASSIFAPTWIGEGTQMHTGTFAFLPCAIAFGLTAVKRRPRAPPLRPLLTAGVALPATFALMIVTTALAPKTAPKEACTETTRSVAVIPSTRVIIGSLDEPPLSNNLTFLDVHNKPFVRAIRATAHPGQALALVYDACAGGNRIAFGDPAVLAPADGFHAWHLAPVADEPKVVLVNP